MAFTDNSQYDNSHSQRRDLARLDRLLWVICVGLGLSHVWAGRYSMDPDGISYLDVGHAFFRHDWRHAFNAYWSPLYGWVLGLANGIFKPSPVWEFPLVHVVNLGIFLLALLAFRFLLNALVDHRRAADDSQSTLPSWVLLMIGYAIFLWSTLELTPLHEVSPDLAASACLFVSVGLLLRARQSPSLARFVLLGLALAAGYWTKAAFFLLAFPFLVAAYLFGRQCRRWSQGIALATTVFLLASAPLVLMLSFQKGRFTFGDSGMLNYAWAVSPRTFQRNWQGEEDGSGLPKHPTRQLMQNPRVFEFNGPLVGTYPPWLDPSYWNEGLQPHFKWKPQLQVLSANLLSETRLLLRAQPALVTGIIALALLSGSMYWRQVRSWGALLLIPLSAFILYAPVHVEDRFLGGYVAILFLILLSAVRVRPDDRWPATCIVIAVFVAMLIGLMDTTVRYATNHLAIPGVGPNSLQEVEAAIQMQNLGIQAGTPVAVIGDGTGAYWARLAKLRVVAEVMAANHDARTFWNSSEETRQRAYAVLAKTGAKLIVTRDPPVALRASWTSLASTPYWILFLESPRPARTGRAFPSWKGLARTQAKEASLLERVSAVHQSCAACATAGSVSQFPSTTVLLLRPHRVD